MLARARASQRAAGARGDRPRCRGGRRPMPRGGGARALARPSAAPRPRSVWRAATRAGPGRARRPPRARPRRALRPRSRSRPRGARPRRCCPPRPRRPRSPAGSSAAGGTTASACEAGGPPRAVPPRTRRRRAARRRCRRGDCRSPRAGRPARRDPWPWTLRGVRPPLGSPAMDTAELVFAGVTRQAQLIRDGEVSPTELVQACLDRIEALDPQLNAWRIVLAERALAEAQQAQGRLGAGDERPLLGVPLAIKDDVRMAGTTTAWGTAAHATEVSDDAVLVQKLREAGAILIGKTNVPEMTIWPFTESKTFGPTRNPWDPTRTPGGSSGGSGAAAASGMVGAATGSDGGGSIRIPAAWCGLFGLKPTRGRVPIAPHVDAWQGLSANGFLTRSVADTALLLDSVAERAPERPFRDELHPPERKLRIAWSVKRLPGAAPFPKLDADWRRALEETAQLLRSLGHEVYERDPDYGRASFPQFLGRYLKGIQDDVDSME